MVYKIFFSSKIYSNKLYLFNFGNNKHTLLKKLFENCRYFGSYKKNHVNYFLDTIFLPESTLTRDLFLKKKTFEQFCSVQLKNLISNRP